MIRIGARRYKCNTGENITFDFSPDPGSCLQKITFDFLNDPVPPQIVVGNSLTFKVTSKTELFVIYHFDPAQVDGICNVSITGSSGGSSPDQIDFNKIPPSPIYTFVI